MDELDQYNRLKDVLDLPYYTLVDIWHMQDFVNEHHDQIDTMSDPELKQKFEQWVKEITSR